MLRVHGEVLRRSAAHVECAASLARARPGRAVLALVAAPFLVGVVIATPGAVPTPGLTP